MDIIEKPNTTDPATKAALSAFLQRVSARSDFTGAILFGSRARGSHQSDSDADVAVLLSGSPGKFVSTKLAIDDLAYEVLLETGIRIQRIPVWRSEWEHPEHYSNLHLLKNIALEGIWLSRNHDFFTDYPPQLPEVSIYTLPQVWGRLRTDHRKHEYGADNDLQPTILVALSKQNILFKLYLF